MLVRIRQDIRGLKQISRTSWRHWTSSRKLRRDFRTAQKKGEKIVLDDYGPPVKKPEQGQPLADFSPNLDVKSRKAHFMNHDEYPTIDYSFEVKNPTLSGNYINGLGETEFRPAREIFTRGSSITRWESSSSCSRRSARRRNGLRCASGSGTRVASPARRPPSRYRSTIRAR